MNEKGICKEHGEFTLAEGCPECLAERRKAGITPEQDEMEAGLRAEGLTLAHAEEPAAEELERMVNLCDTCNLRMEYPVCSPRDVVFGDGHGHDNIIKCANYDGELKSPAAETAVALRPGEDIEARGYFEEALRCLEFAEARVIVNFEDLALATDDLSALAKLKKVMENKRRSLLDPLKLQVEAIRETYSSLMDPILKADRITRDKMLAFDVEQKRIRREQEEVNRLRMEAAQKEMELKGELSEPVGLVEVVPEAPKRVQTDMGAAGLRDTWKWEVIDFSLVPDSYKMINAGVLTPVVKASKGKIEIPGVRIFNEPGIAVNVR